MNEISGKIRELIYQMAEEKNNVISDSSNLYNEGVMDSFNIITIISQLQSELSVDLPEEALIPENFESVNAICNMVFTAISKTS